MMSTDTFTHKLNLWQFTESETKGMERLQNGRTLLINHPYLIEMYSFILSIFQEVSTSKFWKKIL